MGRLPRLATSNLLGTDRGCYASAGLPHYAFHNFFFIFDFDLGSLYRITVQWSNAMCAEWNILLYGNIAKMARCFRTTIYCAISRKNKNDEKEKKVVLL